MTGYRKPSTYVETLRLALKHSPEAMMTLIRNLNHEDRIATMSASLILERAFGKPRDVQLEETEKPQIDLDLSGFTEAELALLAKLLRRAMLPAPEYDSLGAGGHHGAA
jgi:hypothetical protein